METSLTYEERICQCGFIWERFEKVSLDLKMTRYTDIKMRISEGQKDKLKKEFESNCESITICFKFSDLYDEDVIALIKWQLDRLVEAYEEEKDMTIRMSTTQLAHNMKIKGGILQELARFDSIRNWNCFTRFRSWGFIRTGEYRYSKTN